MLPMALDGARQLSFDELLLEKFILRGIDGSPPAPPERLSVRPATIAP